MRDDLRDTGVLIRDILGAYGPMDLWQLQALLRCSRAEARLAVTCLAARGDVCPFELQQRLCFRLADIRDRASSSPGSRAGVSRGGRGRVRRPALLAGQES